MKAHRKPDSIGLRCPADSKGSPRTATLPSTIAIIPARGGSKGIPGKNLRRVGGVPLVARTIHAALSAPSVDRVLVSTDSAEIAEVARRAGAQVIDRPAELSGDAASSESALLHALESCEEEPELTVFLQCTSPFTSADDIERAIQRVRGGADVAFAVVPSHAFLWKAGPDGGLIGINHDSAVRLRRQDLDPEWRETGAFYVMRTSGFRAAGHRFFGRVEGVETESRLALDIDDTDDLVHARRLARPSSSPAFVPAALVLDFDGVFTANTVYLSEDGVESVRCSRGDGMGISLLRQTGLPMLILSTETNKVVAARANKLRLPVLHGRTDKLSDLQQWADDAGVALSETVYIGNDVNDVECLRAVGFAVVPADAHPSAVAVADLQLSCDGGNGAVRELADMLLPLLERQP